MSQKIELHVTAHHHASSSLFGHDDPTDYIVNVHTKFIGSPLEDDETDVEGEIELGTLEFTLLRISSAAQDDLPLCELLDETQELTDLGSAVYPTSDYNSYHHELEETFPESNSYADILLFTHIGLRPHARGVRLGLAIVHRAIRDWSSGCSLVVMDPYPLQDKQILPEGGEWGELELTRFTDSFGDARQRLTDHFAQLGFKPAGQAPYIYYDPSVIQPGLKKLNLPETILVDRETFERETKT